MARDPVKSARRATLRARRRDLAATRDAGQDDRALAAHVGLLLEDLDLRPGAVVTSYAAMPGEPPTAAVNAFLTAHGIRVLLPITLTDFDLDWHDATDPLATPLGPDAVARADLVLAPGLAVDRTGTRMGQGGRLLRPGARAVRRGRRRSCCSTRVSSSATTSPRCRANRTTGPSTRS